MTVPQLSQLRAFGAFVGPTYAPTATVSLGRPSETDSARPLRVVQTVHVGQTSETDSARAVRLIRALGRATEIDSARQLVTPIAIGLTEEADSALHVRSNVPIALVTADEFDFAGTLHGKEKKVFLAAQETDGARVIHVLNKIVNGQVIEYDYPGPLQPYSIPINIYPGPFPEPKTVEFDSALPMQVLVSLRRTLEQDLSGSLALVPQNIILEEVQEIDFARPIALFARPTPPQIIYPTDLPGPRIADIDPKDRLRESKGNGLREVSAKSYDRISYQRLAWTLSAEQAEVWNDWWADDLYFGGRWFSATWPHPRGFFSIERKFMAVPVWTHVGGGAYQLAVDCEVRDLVPYALDFRIIEDSEERVTMSGESRLVM